MHRDRIARHSNINRRKQTTEGRKTITNNKDYQREKHKKKMVGENYRTHEKKHKNNTDQLQGPKTTINKIIKLNTAKSFQLKSLNQQHKNQNYNICYKETPTGTTRKTASTKFQART